MHQKPNLEKYLPPRMKILNSPPRGRNIEVRGENSFSTVLRNNRHYQCPILGVYRLSSNAHFTAESKFTAAQITALYRRASAPHKLGGHDYTDRYAGWLPFGVKAHSFLGRLACDLPARSRDRP